MKKFVSLTLLCALLFTLFAASAGQAQILPPYGEGQIGLSSFVLCEELTVRRQPNAAADTVTVLNYGDRPIVMKQQDGWAYCAMGDSEDSLVGWVNADYLAIDPAWYRTDAKTPVHAWNSANAPKVGLLDKGITLPILKQEGNWLVISLRGASGWIYDKAK